jgi:parvulin-like peptidyl-prolyl isomerase
MAKTFPISQTDLIQQLKLALKIPATVEKLMIRSVVSSHAAQAGITVEATELQEAADTFRLNNSLTTAVETLTWLQKYRLSVDDFEDLIYANLLAAKLARHLFSDLVSTYYQARQSEFVQVVLYEVILDNADMAIELFYALQAQEVTFDEVAKRYSMDARSRRQRGYRGVVCPADLPTELATAVFAANAPEVLRPIVLNGNAHLLYVDERIEPILDESMRERILTELFSTWLKEQVAQADIRYEF